MAFAPGITQWIPLPYGRFGTLLSDPLGFHPPMRERYGDVFRFRVRPFVLHFLYHPDHVRHVLFDNPKNYIRGWQYQSIGQPRASIQLRPGGPVRIILKSTDRRTIASTGAANPVDSEINA